MATQGHQPLRICDLAKGNFSPFPLLKIELCQELTHLDWQQIAELFELTPAEIDAIRNTGVLSPLYFLRNLIKRGMLSHLNVDGFIAALERIDCIAVANRVRKYKQDHIKSIPPDSRGGIQPSSEPTGQLDTGRSYGQVEQAVSGTLDWRVVWDDTPLTRTVEVSLSGESQPIVVLRLDVADYLGSNAQVCINKLEQIKERLWQTSSGTLDHLSGSLMMISLYGTLEEISEGSLLFHVAVPSLHNLVELRKDVSTGRFAEALQQEMCEDMSIIMRDGLCLLISLDSQSVEEAYQSLKPDAVPGAIQTNNLFCDYCKVILEEEWQHQDHISGSEHKANIASKQGHRRWASREPPQSITNGKFEYCREFLLSGICGSAGKCKFAHSVTEYEEWTARHEDRLEVIKAISDQDIPPTRKRGDSKPKSRWDDLFKTYKEEHKSESTDIVEVGSLTFLISDDHLIDGDSGIYIGEFEGQRVAVKSISKRDIQQEPELFERMKREKMSNVLKMVCIEKDKRHYYVATPLCEYDLSHVIGDGAKQIPSEKSLTPERRVRLCVEILTGLEALHSLDIIHRDLKPRNVLIDENGEAVLADFGTSRNLAGKSTRLTQAWGTQYWMATEICTTGDSDSVRYKRSSDVQVAGYLIYFILSNGHHPFETIHPFNKDQVGFLSNLKKGIFSLDHIERYPEKCKDLLKEMLNTDQTKRPKIKECLQRMKDVHNIYTTISRSSPVAISDISLSMNDFEVTCDEQQYSVSVPSKRKVHWTFHIRCQEKKLQHVYLWHQHDMVQQFSLSQPGSQRSQRISQSGLKKEPDGSVCILVHFKSKDPGLSHQWVMFDFGEKTVLCRPLLAWVGPEYERKLPQLGDTSAPFSGTIVQFREVVKPDKFREDLKEQYSPSKVTTRGDCGNLTPDNYKEFFHRMVGEEEDECNRRLRKYNGKQKLVVCRPSGDSPQVMHEEGELFGKIHLREGLDDSGASQVVLKFVHMVLLQFDRDADDVAYIAAIVDDKDFDLRKRDCFYVILSKECVQKQELKDGSSLEVDVQLQLERLSFCEQHFAIDNLRNSQLLFPPENMFPRFPTKHLSGLQASGTGSDSNEGYQLNHRQEGAKNFITRAKDVIPFRQGPSLIIGPFGTGKTFTMAETIKAIVVSDEGSRLLICTQFDSAADPILEQLKDLIKSRQVLQIHLHDTNIYSVSDEKRKNRKSYCTYKLGSTTHSKPSKDTVMERRVIFATFSTSIYLFELEAPRGIFTHIIIDEAGQALETETMMPLGLAGPRTVVVLVGDHKQLRPKVFSEVARRCGYHRSMLERLFYWSKDKNCNNTLFLTDNYRMRQEILDFIGVHCYDIQEQFKAVQEFRDDMHSSYPIAFSAVVGEEEVTGISYKNDIEAQEILRQIDELKSRCLEAQKVFEDVRIAVLTSYVQQVEHIESLVREKKLINVTVDTVQNVQGKQFEVVFISPVRTRKLLEEGQESKDKSLGILSDEGELITAFTRARSLLFAVGDPIALCSSGACSRIWKSYMKVCKDHESLQERNDQEALDSILLEENDVTSSTSRISLSEDIIMEQQSDPSCEEEESDTDVEFDQHIEDELYDEILGGIESALKETPAATVEGKVDVVQVESYVEEEREENVTVRPKRKRGRLNFRPPEGNEMNWVRFVDNTDRSHLESGYSEETEEEAEDMNDNQRNLLFCEKAEANPKDYPICLISVSENNMAFATPSTGSADRIILKGKRMIKRAMDGDQVGVKITKRGESVTYGEVMCIIRRAEDLKGKKLICTLDEENVGLMSPLGYSNLHYYPKMYIYPPVEKSEVGVRFKLHSIHLQNRSNKIQPERDIFVKYSEMSNKLYLVQYSVWFPDVPHPMGIVTEELPPCTTLKDGITILRWRHGVKDKWPAPVRKVIRENLSQQTIASIDYQGRSDFRNVPIFTISKFDYRDLDCAYHAKVLLDGSIELGIHLSDVAHFVEKDSEEDKEAFRRGSSFFDGCAPAGHMLPEKLSTDLCLFKPKEDRLALSIILTCDREASVKDVQIIHSCVRCVCNLTLREVENFLLNENDGKSDLPDKPELMSQLEDLSRLTAALPGFIPTSLTTEEDYFNFPLAYTLLHKVKMLGNTQLAKLLTHVPGGSIVLHQSPPKDDKLEDWRGTHQRDANTMLNPPNLKISGLQKHADMDIPVMNSTYGQISHVLNSGKDKIQELRQILEEIDGFPKQAMALNQLEKISPEEEFVSTGGHSGKHSHFSLCKERVYSYMAPLRSYLDLVIQRMLIAFVTQRSPDPYATDDELRHIAHHCTRQICNARIYEESVQMLRFALKLQEIPHFLPAVVQSASEESLGFSYPFIRALKAGHRKATHVPLRHLKPGERPGGGDIIGKSIELSWRNRIYSTKPGHVEAVTQDGKLLLPTDILVSLVPSDLWEKLIKMIRAQDYDGLEDFTKEWKANDQSTNESDVMKISCEKVITPEGSSEIRKYVEFSRQFHPGHVVKLQLCSQLNHGIPDPSVQLFKLTPDYDICLEHRALPVECFTKVADRLPPCFRSIEDYIRAWSPVLKMLITYSTVMEDETILIRNVSIRWSKEGATPKILGHFSLDKKWCANRQIFFSGLPRKKSNAGRGKQQDPAEEAPALTSDYICVRVPIPVTGKDGSGSKQRAANLKTDIPHHEESTLVVHGEAGRVITGQSKDAQHYEIQFEATQMSCELPDQLYEGSPRVCTVEMIPKSEPMKRMETALTEAGRSGELIESIVLRKPCPDADELDQYFEEGRKLANRSARLSNVFTPNKSQQDAINKALTQSFTVIQGPPGTGKTKTGSLITALFYLVNRQVTKREGNPVSRPAQEDLPRRQILYCGPSNKSVDVIAKDLHDLRLKSKMTDLKFVRVYSDMIEQQLYQIKGVESAEMKLKYKFQDTEHEIKEYALHHLIQTEAGEKGRQMMEMYRKLQSGEEQPTIENIRAFKKLMGEAKKKVLAKKDVILCTCSAAGHSLLKHNLNVVQCIIDEAGMCMELETLVPFTSQKPRQVVLIGDHKQLRPIIQERRVRQLGAEKSLMEKYEGEALSLNIQYRMHEDICRFPSEQFYGNKLETHGNVKRRRPFFRTSIWPGPNHRPRVFCHIVGVEDSLTVRTSEGNENSKSNDIEARQTVRIANVLTRKLKVNFKDVVILSQYRLQCNTIRKKLNPKIAVQTITKSQGSEWDYVILSTVRSLPEEDIPKIPGRGWRLANLGFIEDENQMNVGLTRARRGLIIVGNKNLLRTCQTWEKLITSYEATESVVGAENFLQY